MTVVIDFSKIPFKIDSLSTHPSEGKLDISLSSNHYDFKKFLNEHGFKYWRTSVNKYTIFYEYVVYIED